MHTFFSNKGRFLLAEFIRGRWRSVLGVFLLDLLANICVIVLSLLLAQTLGALFGFSSVRGRFFFEKAVALETLLLSLVGVLLAKFVFDYVRLRVRGMLSEDFALHLRLTAFEQHLNTTPAHHESRDAGRSLLRFSGDLGSAQRLLTHGLLQFAADLTLLLMGVCLVFWLEWRVALCVCVLVLIGGAINQSVNRRISSVENARRGKKAGLLSLVSRTLSHLPNIQALNRTQRSRRDFQKKAARVQGLGYRYHALAALSESLPLQLVQWQLLAALMLAWLLGIEGSSVFATMLVLMSWRNPLARLLRTGLVWKKGLLSLEKMAALMRGPKVVEGNNILSGKYASQLRLRHVSLVLSEKEVLHNVNFELAKGQNLCLHAPTGGGKTTLAKLLAGLYEPSSGMVEWDEQPAESLQAHSVRRQVAIVSEAFPLCGKSLLDALSNGSGAESKARAEKMFWEWRECFPALRSVDLKHRRTLQRLSAGQQQLLQCLRAIVASKPFLILDEPFVGLDAETASLLGRILSERCEGKALLLLTAQPTSLPTAICAQARFQVSPLNSAIAGKHFLPVLAN
ncbi:MAG: ABC transporter ATP-binding protein [Saprospiraceae bacterium]|nr:ABC transporter ATP-binding protein [Saprospiraceae bacterium]